MSELATVVTLIGEIGVLLSVVVPVVISVHKKKLRLWQGDHRPQVTRPVNDNDLGGQVL